MNLEACIVRSLEGCNKVFGVSALGTILLILLGVSGQLSAPYDVIYLKKECGDG